MPIRLALIAAMGTNRVIGRDNDLPWRLSEDLKFFKATTMGKPMVMGRKTFDSIGKPLPGRTTIVVTRNTDWHHDGVLTARSVDSALSLARQNALEAGAEEIMVVGGAEIYRQTLDNADRLYITRVDAAPEGDAFFPEFPASQWLETDFKPGSGIDPTYAFVTLDRRTIA